MEKLREPGYPLPLEAYRDDFQEDVTKFRGQLRDLVFKVNALNKQSKAHMENLDELLPNPFNRNLQREKINHIKEAIKESGEIKPLVITEILTDDGTAHMLIDGHHRYVALKELGYTEVPAVMADEDGIHSADEEDPIAVSKSMAQLRDLVIKINRLTKQGIASVPVQGLGLVREDLGARISQRRRRHNGKN